MRFPRIESPGRPAPGPSRPRPPVPGRFLRAFAGLLVLSSVTGCTEIKWETGRKPDLDVLEGTLLLGQSTAHEVAAALGKPAGEGAVMMPMFDRRPRKILSYYYSRGRVKAAGGGSIDADQRFIALFVYLHNGRYDGYQWFSTLPEDAKKFESGR